MFPVAAVFSSSSSSSTDIVHLYRAAFSIFRECYVALNNENNNNSRRNSKNRSTWNKRMFLLTPFPACACTTTKYVETVDVGLWLSGEIPRLHIMCHIGFAAASILSRARQRRTALDSSSCSNLLTVSATLEAEISLELNINMTYGRKGNQDGNLWPSQQRVLLLWGIVSEPHEIRVGSQSVSQSLDLCGRGRIRVKQPGRVCWWMESFSGIVWRSDL